MTNLGNVKVNWRRYKDNKGRTITVSQLFDKKDQLLSIEKTACGNKDNYNPDRGRKESLARALKEAGLSKKERRNVWEGYRNMTETPRW